MSNAPLVMIGRSDERRPVDAVGRLVRVETARAQGDRLVALVRPAVGVRVLERREVVEPRRRPDDVVLLRAVELEQPQLGLESSGCRPGSRRSRRTAAATPSSCRPRWSGRPRCSTCGRPRRRGRPCGSRSRSPPRGRRARARPRAARASGAAAPGRRAGRSGTHRRTAPGGCRSRSPPAPRPSRRASRGTARGPRAGLPKADAKLFATCHHESPLMVAPPRRVSPGRRSRRPRAPGRRGAGR